MGQDFFFGEQDQFPYDPYNYVPDPGALAVGADPTIPYGSPQADPSALGGFDPNTMDPGGFDPGGSMATVDVSSDPLNFSGLPDFGGLPDFPGSPDGAHPMADDGALFDASAMVPYSPGVPWGRIIRQVAAAARYFGPLMVLPIVNVVAQYWTAMLQKRGLSITITPGQLLMRFLARKGRGRRGGRGITGRQLSITRRTIGKVERMHHAIRAVCAHTGARRSYYSRAPRARRRR